MYDPRVGRWWGVDKIVKPGESPYAAFFNNPINFADPSGLNGVGPGADATPPSGEYTGEYYGPPTAEEAGEGFTQSGRGSYDNPIVYNEYGNVNLPPPPSIHVTEARAAERAATTAETVDVITEFAITIFTIPLGGEGWSAGRAAWQFGKMLPRKTALWALQHPVEAAEIGTGLVSSALGYDGPDPTPIGGVGVLKMEVQMAGDMMQGGMRSLGGTAGRKIALGIENFLDDFGKKYGAETWKVFAKDDPLKWKNMFYEVMNDKNVKVLFNLDGVNVWEGVSRASRGAGGATDWELLQIYSNKEWWGRIDWIENNEMKKNPFE